MSWQTTYVAISALLEVPTEDALCALLDADRAAASPLATELAQTTPERRAARAKALAAELAKVARVLEECELGVARE